MRKDKDTEIKSLTEWVRQLQDELLSTDTPQKNLLDKLKAIQTAIAQTVTKE